jgi:hypothetical protein
MKIRREQHLETTPNVGGFKALVALSNPIRCSPSSNTVDEVHRKQRAEPLEKQLLLEAAVCLLRVKNCFMLLLFAPGAAVRMAQNARARYKPSVSVSPESVGSLAE